MTRDPDRVDGILIPSPPLERGSDALLSAEVKRRLYDIAERDLATADDQGDEPRRRPLRDHLHRDDDE